MPLDLLGKLLRNKEILSQLWAKKQTGHISHGQRHEIRQTVRAIRSTQRSLDTERQARNWIEQLKRKSRKENRMLGIPGYRIREYDDQND